MSMHKVFKMKFSEIYPLYIAKAENKNRSTDEVNQIICWLTGYTLEEIQKKIEESVDFETFFSSAPSPHPNRTLITGSVCGVKISEIEDPIMKEIRYLDKLIDELAKGKAMEKILR